MPTISNVVLRLQHGGPSSPNSSRTVRVNFDTQFTTTEILAGVVFKARVEIRSEDPSSSSEQSIFIRNVIIKAAPGTVSSSVTRTLLRSQLDEDLDEGENPDPPPPTIPVELGDEWQAVINIFPVEFTATTATSPVVTGSWGMGHD